MRTISFSLLVWFLTISHSKIAKADIITHEFTGRISAFRLVNHPFWDGRIQVGDTFKGFYSFDSTQSPAGGGGSGSCGNLIQCQWHFDVPPNRFVFTIGEITAEITDQVSIIITNAQGAITMDSYTVSGNADLQGWSDAYAGLFLWDETKTAIDDPRNLYIDPPNHHDFATNRFQHFQIFGGGGGDFINGRLSTYNRAIPEPASCLILLLTGIVCLTIRQRD